MDATLVLCDHAEAVNGKLYINGGGWNLLFAPDVPVNFTLAVLVEVPWDQTNVRHTLVAELLTADGDPVKIEDNAIRLEGGFEIGRPPGLKAGMTLNAPMALAIQGIALAAGGYEWRLFVDAEQVARKPFRVMLPPGMSGPLQGLIAPG